MARSIDLYPLSERAPERAISSSGKPLNQLTLDEIMSGNVGASDISISPETLKLQAEIARDAGREALALNFERASELVNVPEELILETYEMLRPGRITDPQLLLDRAAFLRQNYGAVMIAEFIEQAVAVYIGRKLFRRRLLSRKG